MATASRASAPGSARPAVIRHTGLDDGAGLNILRVLPAWIISGVVHAVMLSLFLVVTLGSSRAEPPLEVTVIESAVEESPPKEEDLTNPELGINPDVPSTNYDVPRIADFSVPGPVSTSDPIGFVNAPEGPPKTMPPPPGFGGGQGAGLAALDPGRASMFGTSGGMGGLRFVPGGFAGRSGATREQMATEGGGNKESEAAVAAGLAFLAIHQCEDGHWALDSYHLHAKDAKGRRFNSQCTGFGMKNDTAGTAFGLLPFLAAGQTHKPSGEKRANDYTKVVENALRWLIKNQSKEGDLGGGMYAHGLAAIALCEAYGLTSDPLLKYPAQNALNYIVKAQHDGGGWRYAPRQAGDTSVVGWQVMALKSGQMAGLQVPAATLRGAEKFLDSVQSSPEGSGYGYTNPGETPTLSAVGLLCRQYLGWTPRNIGLIKGVEKLKKKPPSFAMGNMYYGYYATQVMHHMGGDSWDYWNQGPSGGKARDGMRDLLIDKQDKGDDPKRPLQKGSWDPKNDAHGSHGGRIMCTSLCLLTLEVYYRHLPLYRRDLGTNKN